MENNPTWTDDEFKRITRFLVNTFLIDTEPTFRLGRVAGLNANAFKNRNPNERENHIFLIRERQSWTREHHDLCSCYCPITALAFVRELPRCHVKFVRSSYSYRDSGTDEDVIVNCLDIHPSPLARTIFETMDDMEFSGTAQDACDRVMMKLLEK